MHNVLQRLDKPNTFRLSHRHYSTTLTPPLLWILHACDNVMAATSLLIAMMTSLCQQSWRYQCFLIRWEAAESANAGKTLLRLWITPTPKSTPYRMAVGYRQASQHYLLD